MQLITLEELDQHLASPTPPVLLDARLEEDYQVEHLPGAKNACVFKMSFLKDIAHLGLVPGQTIVVYGAAEESHESRVAAARLVQGGYPHVSEYRAGIRGWKAAGRKLEGAGPTPPGHPLDGTFAVDLGESHVEWTGRNLLNKHSGGVALKSGHLTFEKGCLVGGDFTLDMNSISCGDLADAGMNHLLIEHLKSEDFFDVAHHPEARFQIRKVESVPGSSPGLPNLRIHGDFSLRGQMKPLVLLAAAGRTPDGRPAAQAVLALDRTIWGSIYGSGKFFHRLGMHLVNDLIEIQVRLLA